jgi:hypothetical protein
MAPALRELHGCNSTGDVDRVDRGGPGRKGRVANTRELIVPNWAYIIPYQIREDCNRFM